MTRFLRRLAATDRGGIDSDGGWAVATSAVSDAARPAAKCDPSVNTSNA